MTPYYQDDACTIYHGDCRDHELSGDLLLTDIPYGNVNRESGGIRRYDFGNADIETVEFSELCVKLSMADVGTRYVWSGYEQISGLIDSFKSVGDSVRVCVWEKTNPMPINGQHLWLPGIELCAFGRNNKAVFNESCQNTVFRYPITSRTDNDHPTPKSLKLFSRLIQASSNAGQLVVDPFMGSGTTLRAAKDLGRKAIGVDIEEKYCEIAAKRLEQGALPLGF